MKTHYYNNIGELVTCAGIAHKHGRSPKMADLSILKKAAFVVEDGKIAWIGEQKKLPSQYRKNKKMKEINLQGKNVFPGFVECHTHLVFAGNRAAEFELRNQGVSYQEIAKQGGGILSTMQATRKASAAQLKKTAEERVQKFVQQGVTTLEIKSGYALNLKDEIKVLQVIKSLSGIRIIPTFLGAHALPPEFSSHREYLQFLATQVLPVIKKKKLAERVDIFIEKGFFEEEIAKTFLQWAQAMGFKATIHADQLSLSGGANLAVALAAQSADHVIQIGEAEIARLAASDVVSVLLPAADLYMKCAYPPARKLIDAGAIVALATDFNPGTSPTQDLGLVGLLARLEMKMSLPEIFAAYTWNAAKALGLENVVGSIEVGKDADFFSSEANLSDYFYSVSNSIPKNVYSKGAQLVASKY